MLYTIDWLIEQDKKSARLKYLFFWGHQPHKDGRITESCLSQWWVAPFVVDGVPYRTAEHYMMAEKARLFNDTDVLTKILTCQSPAEAKKLGRMVQNFDPVLWESHCFEIVVTGNFHKFSQNPDLRDYLLTTGNRILVEASPVDTIWGVGLAKGDPVIENPSLWKGKNLLGFALMEVRDRLH
ncbi:NADAR family protein [Spirosoma harenae]